LETDPEFQSNRHKDRPHFAGDLLHRYFRADSCLLTVSEVAKRLGVCAATVYKLCATGALQHVRVLNSIRVPGECLQAFVASRSSD
jgi:excisionase family DNA binding protein